MYTSDSMDVIRMREKIFTKSGQVKVIIHTIYFVLKKNMQIIYSWYNYI